MRLPFLILTSLRAATVGLGAPRIGSCSMATSASIVTSLDSELLLALSSPRGLASFFLSLMASLLLFPMEEVIMSATRYKKENMLVCRAKY